MAIPSAAPWVVLICRFSDDANDPAVTRLSDLYQQWRIAFGDPWLAANITQAAETDDRTILELYETFFTISGLFSFNVVRYFDEVSHGRVYVGDSKVFSCEIDLTTAEGAALATQYMNQFPQDAGRRYQEDMFGRAKVALAQQHQVDWHDFFGVIVSFQNDDGGAQGYSSIDGGPGVFVSVKWLRSWGTTIFGHEMGHGFGLGHSLQNDSPTPYRDLWDIMSARNVQSAADTSYGRRGPGMNAWNMRNLGWLDEGRVWKGPAGGNFSETIQLRPLHYRYLQGYLAAELPGIGGQSAYTVEFRVPDQWDEAISFPHISVHRRVSSRQTSILSGTTGQQTLQVGDRFLSGNGPFSSVKVLELNSASLAAKVQLCHSMQAPVTPTLKIVEASSNGPLSNASLRSEIGCRPRNVEGSLIWLKFVVTGSCLPSYTVLWDVTGGSVPSPWTLDSNLLPVALPSPTTEVTVSLTIIFDDGRTASDSCTLQSISVDQANWIELLCKLLHERKFPTPWWQWKPELLREVAASYSPSELATIKTRVEELARTLGELERLGH